MRHGHDTQEYRIDLPPITSGIRATLLLERMDGELTERILQKCDEIDAVHSRLERMYMDLLRETFDLPALTQDQENGGSA